MMVTASRFTLLTEPVAIALSEVGTRGFTTLIAAGFVDSFGPTLIVLVVDGQFQSDHDRAPVLRMVLSPFSQSCHIVGYVNAGEVWSPLDDIAPFLPSLTLRSRPTLLIPSAVLPPEITETLYSRLLATCGPRAEGLAKLLLAAEHTHSSLMAFLKAWDGAIQFQYGSDVGRSPMTTEKFMRLLVLLCASCDVPFLQ